VTPKSTSIPSQKRNRRASWTTTDNSSRVGATDKLQRGAQTPLEGGVPSGIYLTPKFLPAPLPLCGAWRAARGSAASDAYSHTNKPPQHNGTRLSPRTEMRALVDIRVQLFSQKSRTPTVAKEFQIGLCGVVEADLELFCNCWSAGFLGERL